MRPFGFYQHLGHSDCRRAARHAVVTLAALCCLASGCISRPVAKPKDESVVQTPVRIPQSIFKLVDLLVVVDNSNSMQEEQTNLTTNFPILIDALRNFELGPDGTGKPCTATDVSGCKIPDIHLGVINTDLGAGNFKFDSCERINGDNGNLQSAARVQGCTPPTDPFIKYIDGQININDGNNDAVQSVKDAFTCIAQLGTDGCAFEQPLESAKIALEREKQNPTFLREDALLAVVFISDEDDCSSPASAGLFDPTKDGITDPLGPLFSYRCFEFGVSCRDPATGQQVVVKRESANLVDCQPRSDVDAKLHTVERYIDFFKGFKKQGEEFVVTAGIIGPVDSTDVVSVSNNVISPGQDNDDKNSTDLVSVVRTPDKMELAPSCENPATGKAAPGVRLKRFIQAMNGTIFPICRDNYGPALKAVGELIKGKLGGQCFSRPPLLPNESLACYKDVALGNGNTCQSSCLNRVDCVVQTVIGTNEATRKTVPRCDDAWFDVDTYPDESPCPDESSALCDEGCWRLIPRLGQCDPATQGSPFGLHIMRKQGVEPEVGTVAEVACSASTENWGSEELLANGVCVQ